MEEDQILYRSFLKGENDAFEQLMDKYMEKLIYFIYSFVKSMDIAEDIAQDVFVYILMNKSKYDFKYSFKTYLYMLAKSRALNCIKKEKRVTYLHDNTYLFDEEDIEYVVFKNEESHQLKKCIDMLPENQSRVIYLVDIEELSYEEICKALSMSLSKVKSLIHRGRKNLKKILLEEEKTYAGRRIK